MVTARWNDQIIAQSGTTTIVEGNHYFPIDSVRMEFLQPSDTHTWCPWKGEASYYTVRVNGEQNEDAAWYYPEPKKEAAKIKGQIAFWRGVEVTD